MKLRKLFVAVAFIMTASGMKAQGQEQVMKVPADPAVKIGQLDNGLTYYIRHNGYPKGKACFYFAQKVGSVQEEEAQRGLAHFLEHMAYNGSRHFKSGDLNAYMSSIGVEDGRDNNAYTSTDRTVYYLTNVPTDRQGVLDSCVMVMSDWSTGLLLSKDEIDKERDVIHNEYRLRVNAAARQEDMAAPRVFSGSKYADRNPIGLMSVIDNFSPEFLRSYYRKWYHPQNQAVIIVGDVDPAKMEEAVRKYFGPIQNPKDAAKIEDVEIANKSAADYIATADKEQQVTLIRILHRIDATPASERSNMDYYVRTMCRSLISQLFNARMSEITQNSNSPLLQIQTGYSPLATGFRQAKTKDMQIVIGVSKDGKDSDALRALLEEVKRVHDFGFTATEYERAKADLLSQVEKAYNNRTNTPSSDFSEQYVEHFLVGDPIPSIEQEYQIDQNLLGALPLEAVNQYAKELINLNDSNLVVWTMQKEGEGNFTEKALAQAVKNARATQLTAYVDNVKQEPLMTELPKKGSITREVSDRFGTKKLTLSNGATVYLKKADFEKDEIAGQAMANGGEGALIKESVGNRKLAEVALAATGLGTFMQSDLQKTLAGKQVMVDLSLGKTKSYMSCSSTPKDLETMFQLIYLNFTNKTKDEKVLQQYISNISLGLKNRGLKAESVYGDSLNNTIYAHNPAEAIPTQKEVDSFDADRMLALQKELYSNAADFTFVFVGNFDEAQMRTYLEQYIASLPSKGKALRKAVDPTTYAKGEVKNIFTYKMENPQSHSEFDWIMKVPYTLDNLVQVDALGRVLSFDVNKDVREDNSAAYAAQAAAGLIANQLNCHARVRSIAMTNPDKNDLANDLMAKCAERMKTSVKADNLKKAQETMIAQIADARKTNNYWLDVISDYSLFGIDKDTDYNKAVDALTPAKLQQLAQKLLVPANHIQVIMRAEKK